MIQVEKLSFGFGGKELYDEVSFSLEMGQHCALIGSNGTGKSTLADMIINPDKYLYDGKILRDDDCRIGYASQFSVRDKSKDCTVFEYLSERFLEIQSEIAAVCEEMADAEDMEAAFEKYQALLDLNEAMDGDNYESNIRKQLHVARMRDLEGNLLSQISGGEYKILQIMREMLLAPNLLVLDEPDVFLDFANLNSLCQLINNYKGTLLVITHNRYLLNHCFNKIMHLENTDLQEFDGTYTQYRCELLKEKLKLKMQYKEEQDEIARTEVMVEILRKRATEKVNPVIGRAVNAKQSQLDRLLDRQIKAPFIEVREPEIVLPVFGEDAEVEAGVDEDFGVEAGFGADFDVESFDGETGFESNEPQLIYSEEEIAALEAETQAESESALCMEETQNAEIQDAEGVETEDPEEEKTVLTITDYQVRFDKELLEDVSFELMPGEKVALVGANGTGKTTLIRDILKNDHPSIHIDENVKYACLSQIQGEDMDESKTVYEVMLDAGFDTRESIAEHLEKYCFDEEFLDQKTGELSGGEQNLLQIAMIANSGAELLIMDEPTSHLDIYAQDALEKAVAEYKGTVLMVSHDFYLVANCADYVLIVEDNTVRRMRTRKFRKMVYDKYFDQKYLEIDRKKQQLEADITAAFKREDLAGVEKLCGQLEELSME